MLRTGRTMSTPHCRRSSTVEHHTGIMVLMRILSHHTKDKGDQGLGFVLACLLKNNIQVALPLSEHLPFDLIAISMRGELRRVSVKFRSMNSTGRVEVMLRSTWRNSTQTVQSYHETGEVDVHAVFCPETAECYFIPDSCLKDKKGFSLRLTPSKNHQKAGVRRAEDFRDPHCMFMPE